jgi:hypothetical protein
MNAQMVDQLFVESYMMMNMEITFAGVRSWFDMSGSTMDDVTLFKVLLFPEQMTADIQAEAALMIVYRYEDVFFQVNRAEESIDEPVDPHRDVTEPLHQLLLKSMNTRTLQGTEDALIDLGVTLMQDMLKYEPLYPSLHAFVRQA